jgi:hypothetical protein
VTLRDRRHVMRNAGLSAATFDEIHPYPHRWTTGVDPSRSLLALRLEALAAGVRRAVLRREADRAARYHAVLEREFLRGYRERAWEGKSLVDRVI